MKEKLLEIDRVSISFQRYDGLFRKGNMTVLEDMSLSVCPGEIVAVIGASGSGKSLLAHAVMGILPKNAALSGNIRYRGRDLTAAVRKKLCGREIVLVPQGVSYLDPLMRVGPQLRMGRRDRRSIEKIKQLLSRYGLAEDTQRKYPFELSGGMARRVLIASAGMGTPKLVIADEPTPGLHLSAAKRVLGHFREMAEEGAGVMLITHDLESVLDCCDRVYVCYAGTVIEEAPAEDFNSADKLKHPYTKALWHAMPRGGFHPAAGLQPTSKSRRTGCPYLENCPAAGQRCGQPVPMIPTDRGAVRCIIYRGDVPCR